jgi:hypothetical protein
MTRWTTWTELVAHVRDADSSRLAPDTFGAESAPDTGAVLVLAHIEERQAPSVYSAVTRNLCEASTRFAASAHGNFWH